MTVKTRAQIQTDADTVLNDNTVGDITPAELRTLIKDLADSAIFPADNLTDPAIVGTILEDVFAITDAAGYSINPSDGSIQRWTLTASRTPVAHANWGNGESVTLFIADGTAYTITWSTIGVVWKGGVAPTLATSGYSEINITKENGVYRGVHVGDFAS